MTREEAIETLEEMIKWGDPYEVNYDACKIAIEALKQEPKTGHWIDEGWYAEGHSEHAYRCSECDEQYIGYVGEYKHCPNCGAKMVEPQESEEISREEIAALLARESEDKE